MSTPVQRQYAALKNENPDAILFFRLGDFYEMFYEDAQLASRVLGITLTARHKGTENEMPMCGIPYHAAEEYLETLLKQGYKVAIAEQIEDPVTKVIHREIVRVVTPGTSLEKGILQEQQEICIASLYCDKKYFALGSADISTGDFRVCLCLSAEDALNELQKLHPREVLITGKVLQDEALCADLPKTHISARPDLTMGDAKTTIKSALNLKHTDSLGLGDYDVLYQAVGMILDYVLATQKITPSHVKKIVRYAAGDVMGLDRQTFRHLEIFEPILPEQRNATLVSVFERCLTPMGLRKLRVSIANPLLEVEKIRTRHTQVQNLIDDTPLQQSLIDLLGNIGDLERLFARVAAKRANPRDIAWIRQSLQVLPALQIALQSADADLWGDCIPALKGFEETIELLERSLVDEPPLEITSGGMFRDDYDVKLLELRSLARNSQRWLEEFLEQKKKETGISTLRMKYSKTFGFCLEVSHAQKKNVPESWVSRQTLVGAERFTTPDLSAHEETVLKAESESYEYEQELFHQLRDSLVPLIEKIQTTARTIGRIDMLLCFARTAQRQRWTRPVIEDGTIGLSVTQGRHPVVEKLSKEPFIGNDTALNADKRFQLITGPNMAGKSTYLRQNALIILLAQAGSFVPAQKVRMGIFDRIFTRVGASDNLAAGKSTFFVEMTETASILRNASERSFVVLDEIGRGTSTFDGISLAWAITEYLHNETKSCVLFATHYHELIDLIEDLPHATNLHISVAQNKDGIVFLRKILPGGISDSFGIEVAKIAGLPSSVIKSSRDVLKRLESENLLSGNPTLFGSTPRVREQVIEVPKQSEVEEKLSTLNLEDLSPKEALDLLYQLKGQLTPSESDSSSQKNTEEG